ncbi:MAG TPA: hypothetical protein PLO89_02110 [Spirochaetota bacterium]|nr:hypothetical protein [Spirochaetota bacterium]
MKKIVGISVFILFFILINTLFFPLRVYKKNIYRQSGFININNSSSDANAEGFYSNRKECGYFSFKGGVSHKFVSAENSFIEANRNFYITYEKVGESISLFNCLGEKIKDIPTFAYPYIPNDNPIFFAIKTNGSGLLAFNFQGEFLYSLDYTSIITSISTDKYSNALVSLLDGRTFLYSPKQEVLFTTDSIDNNSKITMTKSNAIDYNGDYIAICSGIDSEYVDIYQKKTNGRIKKIETDTNYRYGSFMKFDSGRLYYQGDKKLKYYDLKKNRESFFDIDGEIIDVQFDDEGNVIALTKENALNLINVFSITGRKKFYKEFSKDIENVRVLPDNSFYFKIDNFIVKFSYEKS